MLKRVCLAILVLTVAATGCGRKALLSPEVSNDAPTAGSLGPDKSSSTHTTQAQHFEGATGPGSSYVLDVPADWGGDLVLYAHGYTNPMAPVAIPNIAALRDLLLAQGFAVAYSSFSENGYELKGGAQRTHQLAGLFTSKVGPPRRVFLIGSSLGGIIALKLAEDHPSQYAGCLTACGVVGGTRAELDYIGTVRVLFDFFYPGVLPGTLYEVPPISDFNAQVIVPVVTAIQSNPNGAGAIAALLGGRLPFVDGNELVTSILTALSFQLQGANDLFDRTHNHSFFDNHDVVYSGPLPPALLAAVNAGVARYTATPDAANYLEHYYEPSGNLQLPLLTMHTTRDPVVPIFNEAIYLQKASAAGAAGMLLQRNVLQFDRYGHANFTPAEIAANFQDLVTWVDTGVKPAP